MLRFLFLGLAVIVLAAGSTVAAQKYEVDPRWEAERKADFNVSYSPYADKFDIGIGELRDRDKYPDGVRHPITFTLEELALFWKEQQHKEWIVIVLDKWDPTDEQRKALAKKLTDYLFEAGFRRVLIRQGIGGFGYLVVSDATNPKPPESPVPR